MVVIKDVVKTIENFIRTTTNSIILSPEDCEAFVELVVVGMVDEVVDISKLSENSDAKI